MSDAVSSGLPRVQSPEARVLVTMNSGHVWPGYATPKLPAYGRPFNVQLRSLLIVSIETAWRPVVKRKVRK